MITGLKKKLVFIIIAQGVCISLQRDLTDTHFYSMTKRQRGKRVMLFRAKPSLWTKFERVIKDPWIPTCVVEIGRNVRLKLVDYRLLYSFICLFDIYYSQRSK